MISWYDDDVYEGCTCHTGNPPCDYCVNGGWCDEHSSWKYVCGCPMDDEEDDDDDDDWSPPIPKEKNVNWKKEGF